MNEIELSKYYLQIESWLLSEDDLQKLSKLLMFHSDLYYNHEKPIISDYEYDQLFKKLQILEEKFHLSDKQTLKVWSEVTQSTFAKVAHSRPMISLDNTYNEEDLRDFDERIKRVLALDFQKDISYMVEFKFDGLWVELIYENGELIQAITRWNGIEWEDITQNVKTIKNIPKTISYLHRLEVRGEVVMPISSFDLLNQQALTTWGKVFSNPRNAASWSLRLLDTSLTAQRNLKFFAYDLANFETFRIQENKETYADTIYDLEKLWFEISSYFHFCKNIWEVIMTIENFWDEKKRIDFDIDGLVIKVNDVSLWQDIGFTAHHPRYAIAYKFPAQIVTTRVISVEHQIWRTGTLTPVANLEPIFIWGVTVKRATLHNYEEVENLWIHIWDNVFIKRAGEVIPKIIWVAEISWDTFDIRQKILVPETCPSCGEKLVKDEQKVRWYCSNHMQCPEQKKQRLIHSVWKLGLNIDGLWSEQIELFLEKGIIWNLPDIFLLWEKKDILLSFPGYKEKSVNNLLQAIENAKSQKIVNFLVALNIPWIGPQSAKELAKVLNSNDEILQFPFQIADLIELQDIGEETAKNIYDFFKNDINKILLSQLFKYISIEYKKEIIQWKFMWKKVCITGSFVDWSREQLIEKLENMWGIFVSSVSKNTDFLLAWEKAGSKLAKAQSLGIPILTLEDFIAFEQ